MYYLASATVADGKVFVRNALRMNYALNATTGETIWTYDGKYNPGTPNQLGGVTQFMPMVYKYGLLYFNDFYGITCLDARNGSEVWYAYLSRENLAQYLSYSYNRIYTVTEAGALYVLDAVTGEKLSYYEFAPTRSQLHCAPVPYNGSLYIGTNDWNMYCFGEARTMSGASNGASPQPSQTIVPTSITSQSPSPSTQAAPLAIPAEALYAVAIIAVVIIAAVAAILLRKRKK
jgi:outer membrane protein assembly factor BamB